MLRATLLVPFLLLATGCEKLVGDAQAVEQPAHPEPSAASAASAAPKHEVATPPAPEATDPGIRYGVPFAWENSEDEPLAKARSYLSQVRADNALNVLLGKDHFTAFAEKQSPRATVVTCSDSRVQASAWDATPENDAFTIRNIGNQVTNAHGSVEYGLEHLHTPVLLILGHTGCGAVKAAMGKLDALAAPIKAELVGMKLPPADPKAREQKAWADAVIANVNLQADFAVRHFSQLLREQRVLVVGAVYDFRNDLGRGFGRISVVNVNGNTEPQRLRAFETALDASSEAEPDSSPSGSARRASVESKVAQLLKAQAAPEHAASEGRAAHAH